jgi:hypothetical protein
LTAGVIDVTFVSKITQGGKGHENLGSMVEEIFMEIAFVEELEINHLKNISCRFTRWLDNHFTAVTFARLVSSIRQEISWAAAPVATGALLNIACLAFAQAGLIEEYESYEADL